MKKDQIYITPEMEIMSIEVEQAILANSLTIEELGEILEEKEW